MGLFSIFKRKRLLDERNVKTFQTADELFEMGEACVAQDMHKAFQYYLQAANAGHTKAMKRVGHCYLYQGQGTSFDIEQSACWYKKAAESGEPGAMALLSWFYMAGQGVPQSDVTAKSWLQKAINIGDERLAAKAKRELDEFETTKQTVTALFKVAIEMGGIPPKS